MAQTLPSSSCAVESTSHETPPPSSLETAGSMTLSCPDIPATSIRPPAATGEA